MLVGLTVRRLQPGAFVEFEKAWSVADMPPGWRSAYTVRNVNDPDEIISFGFFDGTLEDLRRSQTDYDYAGERAKLDALVASTGANGIFQVVIERDATG